MHVEARADWRDVICAATGPSFDAAQAEIVESARARGAARVIAINDNYLRLPRADLLYACDAKWWALHHAAVAESFAGERWTQDERSAKAYGLSFVASRILPGLTRDRALLHGGGNSGYQAINLAYLFGARRIILVGFDMQRTGGQAHWFGDHPRPLSRSHPYSTWLDRFALLAADLARAEVTVLNATAQSALACFPRVDLASALAAFA